MQRQYAIECTCSHRSERFQLAFARKAIEMLPKREETAFEPTRAGLKVLAETELALEHPLAMLRTIYEDELRIEPLEVRYMRGEQLEEPYMGLRVLCAPDHYDAVKRDLLVRPASIEDSELNGRFGVVRACAPLASLIGYPARIRQLTSGHGQLVMWLSHYAPIDDTPPGGTAA